MDLAEHLKTLRKQAKMTQAQVAKAIEISQQGYAYWEQGKKRPSYDNLVKIAKLFNISVDTTSQLRILKQKKIIQKYSYPIG